MKAEEIKAWYIENQKLYFATLELTQNCNFACRHCYCADKQSPVLPLQSYYDMIDKLHQTGCLFLNFTGGEILTHKHFKDIYLYAKDRGFIIDLLTNASLIDASTIELFKAFPPHSIAVTLYGVNEDDYLRFTGRKENYHKTMQALALLKEHQIPFVLRTVATKTLQASLNKQAFEKVAGHFNTSFKYDTIVFPKTTGDRAPLQERMTAKEIVELESQSEARSKAWTKEIHKPSPFEWSCQGGVNSMAIDFEGNAFVCGLYRKQPISLLDHDIQDVLNHLRRIHQHHVSIVETNACSRCENRTICKWCPAYSAIFNGNDTEKIDYFCALAKERICAFGGE